MISMGIQISQLPSLDLGKKIADGTYFWIHENVISIFGFMHIGCRSFWIKKSGSM